MKTKVGDWIIYGVGSSKFSSEFYVRMGRVVFIDGSSLVVKDTSSISLTQADTVRLVASREQVQKLQAKIDAEWKRHQRAISDANAKNRKIVADHDRNMRRLSKTVNGWRRRKRAAK